MNGDRITTIRLSRMPRRARNWGALPGEVGVPLPGDDLVPEPAGQATLGVDVYAPAGEVWRWLVQIGQDRGGMYSYDRLENLEEVRLNDTVIRRRSKSAGVAPARPAAAPAPAMAAPPPPAAAPAPAPRAPEPVAPPPVAVEAAPAKPAVREPEVVERPAAPKPVAPAAPPVAAAPPPAVEPAKPAAAASPAPEAPPAAAKPVLKTIPQPVVTGSAATGAFIQLPVRPGDQPAGPRYEIKDRDEELRRLGRGAPVMRQPGGPGSQVYKGLEP